MRRLTKIIVLVFVLSVLFTGCGKKNSKQTPLNKEEIYTNAKEVSALLREGKFDEVVSEFDEKMKKGLDAKALKTAWDGVVSSIGSYTGEGSIEGMEKGEYYTCTLIDNYEKSGLKITITYNSSMQISGLFLNYAPLVEESAQTGDFTEEKVTVTYEPSMPLDGLLTLPKNIEKPPVVLLVQGSGPSDKNDTIFSNTPFMDIAHSLAEKGIASLRYDKRYYTYPDKVKELGDKVTLREEILDDVSAAITLLSKDDRVDGSKIFVLGHSLGGMLTPAIAVENNEVKGIISMAGSLRPLYEISYDQNKALHRRLLASDLSENESKTLNVQMQQIEKDIEVLRGNMSKVPDSQVLLGVPAGYQKSVKEYAGNQFIDKVDIPILVLQGKADFQVSMRKDYGSWKEEIGERENAVLKAYDTLNHLMMESNGKKDMGEYYIKGTVNEEVIEDIASFVKDNSSH